MADVWRSQPSPHSTSEHTPTHPAHNQPQPGRRTFLEWLIVGLGAIVAVVLGAPAVAYILDPRNRTAPTNDFKDVARLSELPIGEPREFVIRETVRDAWTLNPDQIVGRVFLIRRDEQRVDAFTTVCPHLGCAVNFTGTTEGIAFLCPCHGGKFDIQGNRAEPHSNPAPRGMDSLPVQRKPNNPDIIQVQYKNFIQNIADKTVRA